MTDLRSQYNQRAHAASLRRLARPQARYAQRDGTGVVSGGNPLRAQNVSNEALGIGDPVVISGDSGVGQQERRRVRRGGEIGRPLPALGEVTVLVSRAVAGQTELWLGGDRPAIQIATIPTLSFNVLQLELVGPSKADWIVALKWGNTTAKMISGNGSHDWQLTDDRIRLLSYFGNGFWGQFADIYGPDPAIFSSSSSVQGSNAIALLNQLGQRTGLACHSQVEGLSTVAVEYCEDYFINGATALNSESSTTNEGIVQPTNSPVAFAGTNISNSRTTATASIVGANTGPGYMGPGGVITPPGTPEITGTELIPTKEASEESSYTRNFSSSVYNAALYGGFITETSGQRTLSTGSTSQFAPSTGGTLKRKKYLGSVREFLSPNQFLWTIYVTEIEGWPIDSGYSILNGLPIQSMVLYERAIAPGVIKSYSASIISPYTDPSNGTGIAQYIYPGGCIPGGYAWTKETINAINPGEASTDALSGTFQFSSGARSRKYYFNWFGSDIEANSVYGSISSTWQPDEINPTLPKSNSVSLLNSSDIFTKNIEAEITISRAIISSGKLSFQAESIKKKVKVKKMLAANGGSVTVAKYWD